MALNPVRNKTSDDGVTRPPIWVEGKQRPKFDFAAFGSVSFGIAKRDLAPALAAAALRIGHLGTRIEAGDWRVTAQWAARVLPSHQTVGAAALGLARVVSEAGGRLQPPEAEALAYPDLAAKAPQPQPQLQPQRPERRARPAAQSVEPTLDAIRSAIRSTPSDLPHFNAKAPISVLAPVSVPVSGAPGWLLSSVSLGLLGVLMLVALPVGAVKAVLYHLDGGDLRDWS